MLRFYILIFRVRSGLWQPYNRPLIKNKKIKNKVGFVWVGTRTESKLKMKSRGFNWFCGEHTGDFCIQNKNKQRRTHIYTSSVDESMVSVSYNQIINHTHDTPPHDTFCPYLKCSNKMIIWSSKLEGGLHIIMETCMISF